MAYSVQQNDQYWEDKLGLPESIDKYWFYMYEYIDDLSFMQSASNVLGNWRHKNAVLHKIYLNFEKIGWNCEGEIQLLWLPPFIEMGDNDTHGTFLFHAKQENDGISWLGSPYPLPFHKIFQPRPRQLFKPNSNEYINPPSRKKTVNSWHGIFKKLKLPKL